MEDLVYKFLNRSLSDEEWKDFLKWLEEPANKKLFNQYIHADYYVNRLYQEASTDTAYDKVAEELKLSETKVRHLWLTPLRIAAASIILLIGLAGGWYYFNLDSTSSVQVVETSIEQGTDKATLTLEDGTEVELQKGSDYQSTYATSNGEEIVYDKEEKPEELKYNYLTVERGGQFTMTLSDGTKVWLNSASRLKYPVSFLPGQTREVELLFGEAYFEVSPATENNGDSFRVNHLQQDVTVIGTEFNIKAYPEEENIYTTLVEGTVEVDYNGSEVVLNPSQQSAVSLTANSITVQEVDVQSETAWKRGLFVFKSKSLKEIMLVLSRWYDIDITIENKELEDIRFKGTLSKDQSLEEILKLIQNTKFINSYDITKKGVVIH